MFDIDIDHGDKNGWSHGRTFSSFSSLEELSELGELSLSIESVFVTPDFDIVYNIDIRAPPPHLFQFSM